MSNLKLLNLPKLILPDEISSLATTSFQSVKPGYTSYKITSNFLLEQLNDIFKDVKDDIAGMDFQMIGPSFNNYIHRDPRLFAINYIIDTGGDNVLTSIFHKEKDITCVPKETWHYFRSDLLHAVQNITSLRKAITISVLKKPSNNLVKWLDFAAKIEYHHI